jgi:hypothetical protein
MPVSSLQRLRPQILAASRLPEFCSCTELVLQTGHPVQQWPLVLVKQLFDNALDASKEAGIAPTIKVDVPTIPSASFTVHSKESRDVNFGSSVTILCPESARSMLDTAQSRFLQIAQDCAWLNSRLLLAISCRGTFAKWKPYSRSAVPPKIAKSAHQVPEDRAAKKATFEGTAEKASEAWRSSERASENTKSSHHARKRYD